MSEPFVGEIRMFAGNFAPRGWAFCDGQLLAVSQNEALFSLLGTIYGGDGRTTFGLPDMRGRVPLHQGSGPIIFRTGSNLRAWRQLLDAQEVTCSRTIVFKHVCLFSLFVYRRAKTIYYGRTRFIVVRCQLKKYAAVILA